MLVPMMKIGIVRVRVPQRLVAVPMRMRLGDGSVVRMPVMLVVGMKMFMLQRLVLMLVIVAFREMQPQAEGHEAPREQQPERRRLAQERD